MNPYSIILTLFIVFGVAASAWGWIIISRSRRSLQWPYALGQITESREQSEHDALLPHVTYTYSVNGTPYEGRLEFPVDLTPTQEFSRSIAEKYPLSKAVTVYYNPEFPQQSTLQPGLAQGDWLVLALGLGSVLVGVVLMFI
ncbi:MAG: DUF3592 domain-containing protein [Gammaproteobacteria bacterium]|nr:DUF3592 domain-containing protein [Gammaproteobacteria bacterium]MDH5801948.1 DUF3592 domain-containing protein [Gammaproteobacteria bacterium]